MRRGAIYFLLLANMVVAARGQTPEVDAAVVERRRLLMSAVLALAQGQKLGEEPGRVALIAWGVDAAAASPKLRNATDRYGAGPGGPTEAQAEIQVINASYENARHFDSTYRSSADHYGKVFEGATMFSVLEPSPEAQTSAGFARVARGYYCIEDVTLRDPLTHRLTAQIPKQFLGHTIDFEPVTDIPFCVRANENMRQQFNRWKSGGEGDSFPLIQALKYIESRYHQDSVPPDSPLKSSVLPPNLGWKQAIINNLSGQPIGDL